MFFPIWKFWGRGYLIGEVSGVDIIQGGNPTQTLLSTGQKFQPKRGLSNLGGVFYNLIPTFTNNSPHHQIFQLTSTIMYYDVLCIDYLYGLVVSLVV